MTYRAEVQNDGASALAFVFHFTVNGDPRYDALSDGAASAQAGTAVAKLSGLVTVDGQSAWSTSAQCRYRTCSHAGTDIGYVEHPTIIGNGYAFTDYAGSVDLGVIQPGQSVQVTYSLHAEARSVGRAGGSAGFGAQTNFMQNDFSSLGGVSVSAVPEPASAALLVGGLAAVFGWRRRRLDVD